MGWGLGEYNGRDIGYGVPAYCDHPGCNAFIDRGLSYVCGGEAYGGDDGCGLFFCAKHLFYGGIADQQLCERCSNGGVPFPVKPDHPVWINHKLTDPSWERWRAENPGKVKQMKDALK